MIEEFELMDGVGWSWKCPICSSVMVISTDIEYVKGFKAGHMGMKHSTSKEFLEENR